MKRVFGPPQKVMMKAWFWKLRTSKGQGVEVQYLEETGNASIAFDPIQKEMFADMAR